MSTLFDAMRILYGADGNSGAMANYTLLTPGDDVFRGTSKSELIIGDHGNDVIDGGRGDDFITGCFGADTLTGGAGRDVFAVVNEGPFGDKITDFRSGFDMVIVNVTEGYGWPGLTFDGINIEKIGRREYEVTFDGVDDFVMTVLGSKPIETDFIFG